MINFFVKIDSKRRSCRHHSTLLIFSQTKSSLVLGFIFIIFLSYYIQDGNYDIYDILMLVA